MDFCFKEEGTMIVELYLGTALDTVWQYGSGNWTVGGTTDSHPSIQSYPLHSVETSLKPLGEKYKKRQEKSITVNLESVLFPEGSWEKDAGTFASEGEVGERVNEWEQASHCTKVSKWSMPVLNIQHEKVKSYRNVSKKAVLPETTEGEEEEIIIGLLLPFSCDCSAGPLTSFIG